MAEGTGRAAHVLYDDAGNPTRDAPWVFRTYGGHSSAEATNRLLREGLARGQTGLSIAFDLPTQCGYDSDHPMAQAEVGKVGVPINSLDDVKQLFAGVPLTEMNTSMTINGTAMWLWALYLACAQERGEDLAKLRGTTQNDIMKEYLARGTYVFPPAASLAMTAEMFEYGAAQVPAWNPSNICSYHLQEAGATPAQELAFALANALALLDAIVARGVLTGPALHRCIGRVSFFVNAGIRFVEEMCKMRAFSQLWRELVTTRYGVTEPKFLLFRYGVQVNSLGLTENQPENNAWRIALELLGVTLSRDARCRALQLPAWNEALSLPRPWDQQWALRLQQIVALETDLLEYPDLFEGSVVVESKTAALVTEAQALLSEVLARGGALAALEDGSMKHALVRSMAARLQRIASGEQVVVGVNRYQEGLPSPLLGRPSEHARGAIAATAGAHPASEASEASAPLRREAGAPTHGDGGRFVADPAAIAQALAALQHTRATRNAAAVTSALARLRDAAEEVKRSGYRIGGLMEASLACAHARVTTGEWTQTLREVFGEYRPSTGVSGVTMSLPAKELEALRARSAAVAARRGRRPRLVVGKPGLDGHSNGAEMIAVAARECGFDVVYAGIRLAPDELATAYVEEDADVLGISILSGSHLELVAKVVEALSRLGATSPRLVVGGIIPEGDDGALRALGVAHIYRPRNYRLEHIMSELLTLVEQRQDRV